MFGHLDVARIPGASTQGVESGNRAWELLRTFTYCTNILPT